MKIEQLVGSAISRVGVVRVRNALNPFLWTFLWSAAFLAAADLFRGDPISVYASLALSALPLLVTLAVAVYFAVKHPDRLQSEEYLLHQRALQMLYRKGASAEIVDALKATARIESRAGGFEDGEVK